MMALAWRLARRELRGGIRGFRIFLACLILSVFSLGLIGLVRSTVLAGLQDQGTIMLGGDAQMAFNYRFAGADERDFINARAQKMSQVLDFRSMIGVGETRTLTQVKAVDDAYPLVGQVTLSPPMPLAQALAPQNGLPGIALDPILIQRLGLKLGDIVHLGRQAFRVNAAIAHIPDTTAGGLTLGPPVIVRADDLAQSGLLGPGSLFSAQYRFILRKGQQIDRVKKDAQARFTDAGMSWRDHRKAAPSVERFVTNISRFLTLIALAGLAIGGIGIGSAVHHYLDRKQPTIATLKTLGAGRWLIFWIYTLQISVFIFVGLAIGLALALTAFYLLIPVLTQFMPFHMAFSLNPRPLVEAGFYGLTGSFFFMIWPLARLERLKIRAIYQNEVRHIWPSPLFLTLLALLYVIFIGGAILFVGNPPLILGATSGIAAAFVLLILIARFVQKAARFWAGRIKNRFVLKIALSALSGPRGESTPILISLGLGLAVLATIGQVSGNLNRALTQSIPDKAPAFFFIDIQPDQIDPFLARAKADLAITRVDSAPMLRGTIRAINDRPAQEITDHWVIRGDRGLSYADDLPAGTHITAGTWWPQNYSGPPQISFAAKEGAEMGLKLGDHLTINVLGRDIVATITSFRDVDFSSTGIGFVMILNQGALQGAPHSHIAAIYTPQDHEEQALKTLLATMPNVTAVNVRDAVSRFTEILTAITYALGITGSIVLVMGLVVLVGAGAAGEKARLYEAAILKTLGASRRQILAGFTLRSALTGAVAGLVALLTGVASAWGVMRFLMNEPYHFMPLPAFAIIAGGIILTLIAGLCFAWRPLNARPARILKGHL